MLTVDNYGCILSNGNNDGGDSARANGIMALFDRPKLWNVNIFVTRDGLAVRHPMQVPWNSPRNFTRDNLICLTAGLSRRDYDQAERLYYSHRARGFFCQNIDRDFPPFIKNDMNGGVVKYPSTKRPYPHRFTELIGNKRVQGFSWFDYRDPLWSPDDIWHLQKCGRLDGKASRIEKLSMEILRKKIVDFSTTPISTEPNQLICKVKIAGPEMVTFFKRTVKDWESRVDYYWRGWRIQDEIAYTIKAGL